MIFSKLSSIFCLVFLSRGWKINMKEFQFGELKTIESEKKLLSRESKN